MKILFTAAIIFLCVGISLFAKNTTLTEAQSMLNMKSIEFIENKGQIADQNGNVNYDVLFISEVPYGTVTIRRDGISCSFIKRNQEKVKAQRDKMLSKERFDKQNEFEDEAIPTEIYCVDMRLKGSSFNPNFEQFEMTEDYNNYYLAHCPDGITHVRKFKTVKLSDVYPNIDFVVYANNDGLVQYDFVVKPGANPNLINFVFEGAKDVEITADGTLKVETPLGSIEQKAPVAYQPYDLNDYLNSRDFCSQSPVPSSQTHFTKNSNNTISFNIANYDQSKPLIIDPPTRLWGTYYGGSDTDYGNSVATDGTGYVYLAGRTYSNYAIATTGSHQSSFGGDTDAFLVKFNSDGVRQWATYYGGSGYDYGYSVATAGWLYVYLAGTTESSDAIATAGSHQSNYGGGDWDAFLVKFNSDGVRQWGTYYGGDFEDCCTSVAIDGFYYVYIVGYTASRNAIVTAGSHQTFYGGGLLDVFLVKFNTTGFREWGTYYGGTNSEIGTSIATDGSDYVYLTGRTNSINAIATAGSHQSSFGGSDYDAFLIKFNSSGVRQWGTYYGGSSDDYGNSLAIDGSGYLYLAGRTGSLSSISTAGSHQSTIGGWDDAFLVKFNSNGIRQWGTYYGGIYEDNGNSLATDGSGYVYLIGWTYSSDSIATTGSYQSSLGSGYYSDAFLVKFNGNGVRQWGTYYGGSSEDYGYSVATDGSGYVYLAGSTGSSDSIATAGSHQSSFGGGIDAFLVKFESEYSYVFEEEIVNDYFSIEYFPNPFQSKLNIKLLIKQSSNFTIDIWENTGKYLEGIESKFLPEGEYNFSFNSNIYPDGNYFLRVFTNEQQFTYKLIHLK